MQTQLYQIEFLATSVQVLKNCWNIKPENIYKQMFLSMEGKSSINISH